MAKKVYTIRLRRTNINLLWLVLTSSQRNGLTRSAGPFRIACRWAPAFAGHAAPERKRLSPAKPRYETSAILATPTHAHGCPLPAALILSALLWPWTRARKSSFITSMTAGTPRWTMAGSSTITPRNAGSQLWKMPAGNARPNVILLRILSAGGVSLFAALQPLQNTLE